MVVDVEELWDEIGVRLKHARENAGMSVDDVVFRARIPRSVVEALEAEDFSVFTSPTYAKSFLRQYSEFLDVDADPWLDALEPAAYVTGDGLQPMLSSGQTLPPAKRPARETRRAEVEPQSSGEGKWSALWVTVLTAALVVGIIKGYQVFDTKLGGHDFPGTKNPPQMTGAAPEPDVPAEKKETAAETPADPEEKKETPQPPRAVIVRE